MCIQNNVCEFDISIVPITLLSTPFVQPAVNSTVQPFIEIFEGIEYKSSDLALNSVESDLPDLLVYSLMYSRPVGYDACPNLFSLTLRGSFDDNIRYRLSYTADTDDYFLDSAQQIFPQQVALSLPCDSGDVIFITLYQKNGENDDVSVDDFFTVLIYSTPNAFFVLDPNEFPSWHYSFMMSNSAVLECEDGVIIKSCGAKGADNMEEVFTDTCTYQMSMHKPISQYGVEITDVLWPPFSPVYASYASLVRDTESSRSNKN